MGDGSTTYAALPVILARTLIGGDYRQSQVELDKNPDTWRITNSSIHAFREEFPVRSTIRAAGGTWGRSPAFPGLTQGQFAAEVALLYVGRGVQGTSMRDRRQEASDAQEGCAEEISRAAGMKGICSASQQTHGGS